MGDYYDILEVSRDASPDQIRRSYHALALRYHPDKAGEDGAAMFKEINAAYEVLSDPKKKDIYDKYGKAGLNAMDNPMADSAISAVGVTNAVFTVVFLLFVCASMVLIFLAFLVSYVDGGLTSWNYVKVFSPLFVVDVLVGVPIIFALIAVLVMMPKRVEIICLMLSMLCAIILTIVIPIAKDRNEQRVAAGRTDYLKWRVWLIPGYLLSVFLFISFFFMSFPSRTRRLKLHALGLFALSNYMIVSFIFTIFESFCVVVFFALVACRADEVIRIDYFIVIGLPVFAFFFFFLLDMFFTTTFEAQVEVPEGNERAGGSGSHHHEESNNHSGAPEGNRPPNPMQEDGGTASPRGAQGHAGHGASGEGQEGSRSNHYYSDQSAERREAQPDAQPPHYPRLHRPSPLQVICSMLSSFLVSGLCIAATVMIAVRLNYFYHYETYYGVMSLARACSPLFAILAVMVLTLLISSFLFCCSTPEPLETREEQEAAAQQAAETEMHPQQSPEAERHQATQQADDGPHSPPETHQPRPKAREELNDTPPQRYPNNENLSDID